LANLQYKIEGLLGLDWADETEGLNSASANNNKTVTVKLQMAIDLRFKHGFFIIHLSLGLFKAIFT